MSAGHAVLLAAGVGAGLSLVLLRFEDRDERVSAGAFVRSATGVLGMVGYACFRNGFWLG